MGINSCNGCTMKHMYAELQGCYRKAQCKSLRVSLTLSSRTGMHTELAGLLPLVHVGLAECLVWQCLGFHGQS